MSFPVWFAISTEKSGSSPALYFVLSDFKVHVSEAAFVKLLSKPKAVRKRKTKLAIIRDFIKMAYNGQGFLKWQTSVFITSAHVLT